MSQEALIAIDKQGRVVLPRSSRSKRVDYYTCRTEEDGTVHLIPVVGVITAKQAYFWTKRWRAGESEVQQDLHQGKYKIVPSKSLRRYLDKL